VLGLFLFHDTDTILTNLWTEYFLIRELYDIDFSVKLIISIKSTQDIDFIVIQDSSMAVNPH